MEELEGIVQLAGGAWRNIKRNIIEQRKKESMGDLIGKKIRLNYRIINSYPWVNAETTPTGVGYGNESARKRIIKMDRAEREIEDHSIIGCYHTHVYERIDKRVYMAKEDKILLRGLMKNYKLEETVQIIGTVKIKDNSKRKSGEKTTQYKNKLRITFSDNSTSYDVILAAYILNQKLCEKIPIKRRYVRVVAKKE